MTKLIGIAGSLRKGSLNRALLAAAAELAPPGVQLEVATLHGIPVYDGDLESDSGLPESVVTLKRKIADADGIVIATPEYNQSLPGPLKNAIDWCTRPASDIATVFGGKPLALMGATPGPWGTKLSQAAWLPVLRSLGVHAWLGGQLFVPKAGALFEDGRLVDPSTRERLEKFMAEFATFARSQAP